MFRAACPDCGEVVAFAENVQPGDRVFCSECGIELQVLSVYPFELDSAPEDAWGDAWDGEQKQDDLLEELDVG